MKDIEGIDILLSKLPESCHRWDTFNFIDEFRTRLHKHMRTSFRQILPQTSLKILAGRKPACGFLPTLQQNYARKSAHISYEDRFLNIRPYLMIPTNTTISIILKWLFGTSKRNTG